MSYITIWYFSSLFAQLFDPDEQGYITYKNFVSPIQSVLPLEEKYIKLIYKDIDPKKTDKASYGK